MDEERKQQLLKVHQRVLELRGPIEIVRKLQFDYPFLEIYDGLHAETLEDKRASMQMFERMKVELCEIVATTPGYEWSELPNLRDAYKSAGGIFGNDGELKEAESYYRKALKVQNRIVKQCDDEKNRSEYADIFGKLGLVLNKERKYAEARKCLNSALNLHKQLPEETNDIYRMGHLHDVYLGLGEALCGIKKIKKAKESYCAAEELLKDIALYEEDKFYFRLLQEKTYEGLGKISRMEGNVYETVRYHVELIKLENQPPEEGWRDNRSAFVPLRILYAIGATLWAIGNKCRYAVFGQPAEGAH